MKVYEFADMFLEPSMQKIAIYNLDDGNITYRGTMNDIPIEYEDMEIASIDNIMLNDDTITVNV